MSICGSVQLTNYNSLEDFDFSKLGSIFLGVLEKSSCSTTELGPHLEDDMDAFQRCLHCLNVQESENLLEMHGTLGGDYTEYFACSHLILPPLEPNDRNRKTLAGLLPLCSTSDLLSVSALMRFIGRRTRITQSFLRLDSMLPTKAPTPH